MRTLVVGAAASGKSEFAESLCLAGARPRVYVATMNPLGSAARRRIERHRSLRAGKGFETIERPRDVGGIAGDVPGNCTLLFEDVGNLVANELFEGAGIAFFGGGSVGAAKGAGIADEAAISAFARTISDDIDRLSSVCADAVIVSVDVFSDGVLYDSQTDRYARALAQVNALVAQSCERVVEVVCGIPVWLKGEGAKA